MATLRELKTRIGSVASSEKITGAMKMISSAKMHKAEMSLPQARSLSAVRWRHHRHTAYGRRRSAPAARRDLWLKSR